MKRGLGILFALTAGATMLHRRVLRWGLFLVFLGIVAITVNCKDSTSEARSEQPRYFKSFNNYVLPEELYDRITFDETKGLTAFFEAHYGEHNRLVRLVKYFMRRQPLGDRPMGRTLPPGSLVFFSGCESEVGSSCQEVSYESTEGKDSYFEGHVGPGGNSAALARVTRQRFFDAGYAYWPNGTLREHRWKTADGSEQVRRSDKPGEPPP